MLLHMDGTLDDVAGTPMAADGTSFVASATGWGQALSVDGTHPGGGGANVVYSAATVALDLNASDFTIEARMMLASLQARPRYVAHIVDAASGSSEISLGADRDFGDAMKWFAEVRSGPSTTQGFSTTGVNPAYDVPHHVALTRQGNTVRLFADGDLLGTIVVPYRNAPGPKIIYIGNSGRFWVDALDGTIDELCITAACLYTAPFAPPAGPYANFWPVSARAWPGGVHTV